MLLLLLRTITVTAFLCGHSVSVNLQPINTYQYQFIYRLVSIVIDYRIHRLDTPGVKYMYLAPNSFRKQDIFNPSVRFVIPK